MPIYKQTTEITNIDDLLSSVERNIEEVYFGDKNVFTVWAEYDGTLPATYTANGSVLADYRIYGSVGGVGDRTINLVGGFTSTVYGDLIITVRRDGALLLNGKNSQATTFFSTKITLSEGLYAMNNFLEIDNPGASTIRADIRAGSSTGSVIDDNKAIDNGAGVKFNVSSAEAGELFYVIRIAQNYLCNNVIIAPTLTRGTTIPIAHVPYGYEVDMSIKSGNLFNPSMEFDYTSLAINNEWRYTNGITKRIPCEPNQKYSIYLSDDIPITVWRLAVTASDNAPTYNEQSVVATTITQSMPTDKKQEFITPSDAKYILFQSNGELNEQVNAALRVEKIVTVPIYIGSSPLETDEYVDYVAGKIYRRTAQLFNKNTVVKDCYISLNGEIQNVNYSCSDFIPISAGSYYLKNVTGGSIQNSVVVYDANKRALRYANVSGSYTAKGAITFTDGDAYIRVNIYTLTNLDTVDIIAGSIEPTEHIPYVAPVDPPVPLPALPTVDGTTIVDYVGQSAAIPSRFVAKYRKEGF